MTNSDKLYIDFETYSEVDIRKHGSMRYASDESTQVICLGYAFNNEPAELWTPDQDFPLRIIVHINKVKMVYAHNAIFDWRIWNLVLWEDFAIPKLRLEQCIDSMALCQTYTIPASLAFAGAALNINLPKLESGVRLINKCCKPDKNGDQPMPWDNEMVFKELFMYCKRDVEAMREIVNTLPRDTLIPIEQEVWMLTARMNELGLPVDIEAVKAILSYLGKYVKDKMSMVSTITGGEVQTVNQIAKILEWCKGQGIELPNLQAGTLEEALASDILPSQVQELLQLRQELGRTSTAKFKKIKELEYNGWVHNNLQYHGAGPGRWAGRGFQMQNLPRASVPNPEDYIKAFMDCETVEDPVTIGKALIRSMVLAPPGETIICSDYHSIENRILAWLAGDEVTLQGFREGLDQYVDMAATLYNISHDQVTKDQRQFGKVIILGAGYQMGAIRFQEVAADWGITLESHEAKFAIDTYREKYYLIKRLWKRLHNAAIEAIMTGKRQTYLKITFGTATVNGVRWLAMKLPSGKSVYYMHPSVENKFIPGYEYMGEVPTITHSGINPYSKKWGRLKITPGRLTENATQGTAREVMAQGMLNVQEYMPEIRLILSVHDEAGGLVSTQLATKETMARFNNQLCDIKWAEDCPLAAEGYFSKRYKKG